MNATLGLKRYIHILSQTSKKQQVNSKTMSTSTQHYFAYLHGFASGPQTKKGVSLVNRLKNDHNIDVEIPDLNVPSFAQLTYSGIRSDACEPHVNNFLL